MKPLPTALALVLFLANLCCFAAETEEKGKNPLIGHWRWPGQGTLVDVRADGSVQSIYGAGVWKEVESKTVERKYEISWKGGAIVDKVTLSKDYTRLRAKNNNGVEFTADKVD